MPYSRLTNVADYDAVLTAIRNFIDDTGDWTIHEDLASPDEGAAAGGHQLVVSNDDCLAGLRSTTTGDGADRLFLFDGVPPWSASDLDSMPGNSGMRYEDLTIDAAGEPSVRHLQAASGPFPTVDLFTNDASTYLHAVVQQAAGIFKHLWFGNVEKFGSWTGGAYYATTYWSEANPPHTSTPSSAFNHAPLDSSICNTPVQEWTAHYERGGDLWIAPSPTLLNGVQRNKGVGSMRGGFGQALANSPEIPFSGLVPMASVMLMARHDDDSPKTLHMLGRIPDVRMVNIQNFAPGETYSIGADDWIIFPLCTKNGIAPARNSGTYGYAYLVRS